MNFMRNGGEKRTIGPEEVQANRLRLPDLSTDEGAEWWKENRLYFLGVISNLKGPQVTEKHGDDILQELYVRILERQGQFRGESDPRTWAVTILKNILRDIGRKARARQEANHVSLTGLPESEHPKIYNNGNQPRQVLEELSGRLPKPYKEIIIAELEGRRDGKATEQIAEQLGLRVSAFKTRLFRARQGLKLVLSRNPRLNKKN